MIQQAISEPSAPPLATEKFQPMNSPTSTMPTPSAQTWMGPRTFSRLTGWPWATTGAATGAAVPVMVCSTMMPASVVAHVFQQFVAALARAEQHILIIFTADAHEVHQHPGE